MSEMYGRNAERNADERNARNARNAEKRGGETRRNADGGSKI